MPISRGRSEIKEAIDNAADVLVLEASEPAEAREAIAFVRELSKSITVDIAGNITLENVRSFAEVGADVIRVDALTQSVRAMSISFQIQPG